MKPPLGGQHGGGWGALCLTCFLDVFNCAGISGINSVKTPIYFFLKSANFYSGIVPRERYQPLPRLVQSVSTTLNDSNVPLFASICTFIEDLKTFLPKGF